MKRRLKSGRPGGRLNLLGEHSTSRLFRELFVSKSFRKTKKKCQGSNYGIISTFLESRLYKTNPRVHWTNCHVTIHWSILEASSHQSWIWSWEACRSQCLVGKCWVPKGKEFLVKHMCSKIKVRTTDFKIRLYSLYSPIYIDVYLLWSRPYIHLSFGQSNKIPPPVGHPRHWPNPKLSLPRRGHGPGVERSSHEYRTCSFKTMGCNTNGWRTRICYTSSNDIMIFCIILYYWPKKGIG